MSSPVRELLHLAPHLAAAFSSLVAPLAGVKGEPPVADATLDPLAVERRCRAGVGKPPTLEVRHGTNRYPNRPSRGSARALDSGCGIDCDGKDWQKMS